jgi:excisionase family DNA binding protein
MARTDEDNLVSIDEGARRLGLKSETLRLWARQRKIATVKLGSRRLMPESEIVRLITTNLVPALPQQSDLSVEAE